jgi:hypothetical protein
VLDIALAQRMNETRPALRYVRHRRCRNFRRGLPPPPAIEPGGDVRNFLTSFGSSANGRDRFVIDLCEPRRLPVGAFRLGLEQLGDEGPFLLAGQMSPMQIG